MEPGNHMRAAAHQMIRQISPPPGGCGGARLRDLLDLHDLHDLHDLLDLHGLHRAIPTARPADAGSPAGQGRCWGGCGRVAAW